MNAILLTIFVGFVLVGCFVLLFLVSRRDAAHSCAERDSLLPLEEEGWRRDRRSRSPAEDHRPAA